MMEGDQKMRAHYIYVLTREASMAEPKERTMTGFYSCGSWQAFMPKRYQGFGTTEERGAKVRATPKLVDLFACLVSDAQGTDGATFEQWASDYGYDTDSRSAERTFIACQQTAKELREFLGREDYNFLMNEVEQY